MVGTVILLCACAGQAAGPLPVFNLTDPAGKTITSVQAALAGNWVLVYVQPPSGYGDIVLSELNDGTLGTLNSRVVIVVGGLSKSDAQKYLQRFPHLKGASWYTDESRTMAGAMHFSGAPAAFGMKDQAEQWQFLGTLPDNTYLRSILKSWREKAN